MQAAQDFEASAAGAANTDQGDALAVLMGRVVLERLFAQTKSELQRVPRPGRKRS